MLVEDAEGSDGRRKLQGVEEVDEEVLPLVIILRPR